MKLRSKVVKRAFMGETRDYVLQRMPGFVVTSPTSIHDVRVSVPANQIVEIA